MKTSQADWAQLRRSFIAGLAERGVRLSLRDRVWAVTADGDWIALPGTSDSPVPDRWWLGCDPEKLRARRPVGVALLCQARSGPLHVIGIPSSALREIEPKLSRNARQLFFNVARRGDRFLLQLRGGEELDVTQRLEDLSWIAATTPGETRAYRPPDPDAGIAAESVDRAVSTIGIPSGAVATPRSVRFFARCVQGALVPIDESQLEESATYLVEVQRVDGLPATRALRRILARGGPNDLPADLAERHDHYARGTHRA